MWRAWAVAICTTFEAAKVLDIKADDTESLHGAMYVGGSEPVATHKKNLLLFAAPDQLAQRGQ